MTTADSTAKPSPTHSPHLPEQSAPPPPYFVPDTPQPAGSFPAYTHTQPSFNHAPLPLPNVTALPYYDPRSPYAVQQADLRARHRFVEALAYGVLIWLAALTLCGASLESRSA